MDLDAHIQQKRAELKEKLAALLKAREAAEDPQSAATEFARVSAELAELHRQKYGNWHITWGGNPQP